MDSCFWIGNFDDFEETTFEICLLRLGVLIFGHELCDEEEVSLQIIFEREILCAQEMTNMNYPWCV